MCVCVCRERDVYMYLYVSIYNYMCVCVCTPLRRRVEPVGGLRSCIATADLFRFGGLSSGSLNFVIRILRRDKPIGLYKRFVYSEATVHESTILSPPPPAHLHCPPWCNTIAR